MFATFHLTNPSTFYNREDQWDVPTARSGKGRREADGSVLHHHEAAGRGGRRIHPDSCLTRRVRKTTSRRGWSHAATAGNYGQLMAFQFPKQTVIFGPRQVAARISQDQVIAPQITLWNQQGSEVIQGNLLVIPIEESLLYIRPLYLRARGRAHSRVEAGDRRVPEPIVMEATLDEALERLFPASGGGPTRRAGSSQRAGARRSPTACGRIRLRRWSLRPATRLPRRSSTTSARSKRSAQAIGPATVRKFVYWVKRSNG